MHPSLANWRKSITMIWIEWWWWWREYLLKMSYLYSFKWIIECISIYTSEKAFLVTDEVILRIIMSISNIHSFANCNCINFIEKLKSFFFVNWHFIGSTIRTLFINQCQPVLSLEMLSIMNRVTNWSNIVVLSWLYYTSIYLIWENRTIKSIFFLINRINSRYHLFVNDGRNRLRLPCFREG